MIGVRFCSWGCWLVSLVFGSLVWMWRSLFWQICLHYWAFENGWWLSLGLSPEPVSICLDGISVVVFWSFSSDCHLHLLEDAFIGRVRTLRDLVLLFSTPSVLPFLWLWFSLGVVFEGVKEGRLISLPQVSSLLVAPVLLCAILVVLAPQHTVATPKMFKAIEWT